MLKEDYLKALKGGMKGELESITLYEIAKDYAESPEVRNFLDQRIEEEKRHYNYLLDYYNDLSADKPLCKADLSAEMVHPFISDEIIDRISGKQILFSTISTAVLLEKTAFEYYRKCADEADIPELKSLFHVLAEWEVQHYDDLLKIEKEAEKEYWQRNRFEPF